MPGWHADALDQPQPAGLVGASDGSQVRGGPHVPQPLFPEEAIGMYGNRPIPFGVSFEEETEWPSWLKKLVQYIVSHLFGSSQPNNWLGVPMPAQSNNESDHMRLVRELTRRARNYNAALYLLRQYHYQVTFNFPAAPVLVENPHGPKDPDHPTSPLPHPADQATVTKYAGNVERAFLNASRDLNDPLEPRNALCQNPIWNPLLKLNLVAADMIEVNGYIVSLRVMVQPLPHGITSPFGEKALEIIGSSSHFSISSAFSSH